MTKHLVSVALLLCAVSTAAVTQVVWLDELDLSTMECGWRRPGVRASVEGNRLTVRGQPFDRGVGTHATSTMLLRLDGKGTRFHAAVGVDDEAANPGASVTFVVLGDREVLWESGVMKHGDSARTIDLDLSGVRLLGLLVTDGGDGIDYDHADWCDGRIEFSQPVPSAAITPGPTRAFRILTPRPPDTPRINGARVAGVRPGRPFLYTIAATGKRPMRFTAADLPPGLTLDSPTGIITGSVQSRGRYVVTLTADNEVGSAERELRIVVGDTIALTPPMGWNSWNCWATAVDEEKVRAAADAMVSSGLINHGWTYVNIDDCWMVKPDTEPQSPAVEPRDATGMINTNSRFPDMKALAAYVHGKGLKLGIYSSPGPLTCAGYTGSYRHEVQDAHRFAEWGIDYLKYDWCSYGRIATDRSLPELKKPYAVMRDALAGVPRDIVYSLCQYGMGDVWTWGTDVGGNCWRTTGDITDTWASMAGIGFGQAGLERYARPGHWNDPDMLVVGFVGWGPQLHPTHLTPDEQYTHISLWSLLASPLLIGCDMSRMDDFTLSLLTNDEVLAINQDPLGRQARRIKAEQGAQVWMKEMEDGSRAVGLFHASGGNPERPADYFAWEETGNLPVAVSGDELGFSGPFAVRDVWRQEDLGVFTGRFEVQVPYHGVVLVRMTAAR